MQRNGSAAASQSLPFSSSGPGGYSQLDYQQRRLIQQHQHQLPQEQHSLPATPVPPDLFTSAPLAVEQTGTPFASMSSGYYPVNDGLVGRQQEEHDAVYQGSYRSYGQLSGEGGENRDSSHHLEGLPPQQQQGYYGGGARGWEQQEQQPSQRSALPPAGSYIAQPHSFPSYPSSHTSTSTYTSYATYHAQTYSHPSLDHHYPSSAPSNIHPSPAQVGELYQPSLQSAGPLVPAHSHLSAHDSRRPSYFPSPLPNRFATYPSPYSPAPPSLPSHHPTPSSTASSSYPPENAVAGPSGYSASGLTQHLSAGELDVVNDQLYSNSVVVPSSATLEFSAPAINTRSSVSKGKTRQYDSTGLTSGGGEEASSRSQQPAKRRREAKDVSMRKYVCTECDQRFARPSALATHILTHTKEKPFICFTCNRGFAVMSNLRRHCRVRSHVLAPSQEANGRPRGSGGTTLAHVQAERRSFDSTGSSSGSSGVEGGLDSVEPSPGSNVAVLPPLMESGGGKAQSVFKAPPQEELGAFA